MLLSRFQQQLTQHFPQQPNVLLSLSGGIDSVVLLDLFSRTTTPLRAIYIHHGLSANADNWADFCEALCKQYNIPFILQKVTVDKSTGIEAGARTARYKAIAKHIQANEILATAHHLNDQAETFLLALKRGSGVKGLSAMQIVSHRQNMTIFRPLLSTTKKDIQQYAKQQQLCWIEDESNQNNHYDRNFLRNQILPLLLQRWPQFNQMIARSAKHCTAQQQLLAELLDEELHRYANIDEKSLQISQFKHFSPLKQQQLIRLWLAKCDIPMPTSAQFEQIISGFLNSATDKNPQLRLENWTLRRFQKTLYLTPQLANTQHFCQILSVNQTIDLPDNLGQLTRQPQQIIYQQTHKTNRLLLPESLRTVPLTIKLHQTGKVKRYQHPHSEEMKKLYQQAKIPVWQRTRTVLVFFEDQLVDLLTQHKNPQNSD
ncbi:tRNA lysidine(34) synthetase TilS [[Haemophilus] ducreyi]|uniref:tRNA lysidine(34) synthetase TilS n=1 Tax=Haemophilus ducreyi TaxID=730 RepID=UPI0006558437|nr:tRNA lysidine(34) synthetase TilS [[Haemophilus] ducreyi]AKO44754.1 tRNA(Ile)-lysidine synthetase [[Haemophilus] ducreyi]AKO46161.1 tRNA(Ile)-lysidine synthetase [[Haemophilus] ducreyi]AKO47501.1 tRNA(Ile)-lysidine synthetase [[Haemophilus] ducreyi]AKO48886.1 tRNA(Ile)-lysidine synthetase [[Haemophilus] ducreyi]ANF61912.1 tRNA(Ile)-lysidine synthase [[Haemophilus] ducreyi]